MEVESIMNKEPVVEKMYLTVEEAARMLGINLNAMYLLCRRSGFPAVRVSPRRIVIPAKGLHDWMLSNHS